MSLDDLREKIKETDQNIISLIEKRVDIAQRIGKEKAADGQPIKNYHVEQAVLDRYKSLCDDAGLLDETADQLTEALIKEAVRGQETDRRLRHGQQDGDRYLIVGGEGNMGRWFQDYLRQGGAAVTTVDKAPEADHASLPSLDGYDGILLTTPIRITPQILAEIRRREPPGVVADIASVKAPVADELRAAQDAGLSVTSFHPMFDHTAKTLNNANVLIASLGDREADRRIQALFEETAANVKTVSFEEHDDIITYTLALPHITNLVFGAVLQSADATHEDHADTAGTTFRKQAEAASEVFSENPEVYHAIQHYNEHSASLFEAVSKALTNIRDASEAVGPTQMESLMRKGQSYFSDDS